MYNSRKLLLIDKNLIKILPIIRVEYDLKETIITVKTNSINEILLILKYHFKYQFKSLISISGVDYPENLYRFQVVYELLSIKYNSRIRTKILVNELIPVNSAEKLFAAASWFECEVWDMFGIFFLNHSNLTRILTDYGFQGYPLRKDFPLTGFIESRYSTTKERVIYENLELAQEYRVFESISPWENFSNK